MQSASVVVNDDLYMIFEVYAYASERYPDFLEEYGELAKLTQSTKALLDYTESEITRLDQWGRYNLYVHNPDLFTKHRANLGL